jgi:hypothetical protein
MAIGHGVHVACAACAWQGSRTYRDPTDPNRATSDGGYGPCPRCGGTLRRRTRLADRRAVKAKADLAAAEGDQL